MSIHPPNLNSCREAVCEPLRTAWQALSRGRDIPFDPDDPTGWERAFHEEARRAVESIRAHDAAGPCVAAAGRDRRASGRDEHLQLAEMLAALAEWTDEPATAPRAEQVQSCRDGAFTAQLRLILHHWRIAQVGRLETERGSGPEPEPA